ncbi:MAG: YciI family protein [Planctomycetota bacterium]
MIASPMPRVLVALTAAACWAASSLLLGGCAAGRHYEAPPADEVLRTTTSMERPGIPSGLIKRDVGESLGLQLYVVESRAVDLEHVKRVLADHRAYLRELERTDVLFAAGPTWSADGDTFHGDGIIVLRANSPAHAARIAEEDPMHDRGARAYSITPWMLNDGALTLRVELSTRHREVR